MLITLNLLGKIQNTIMKRNCWIILVVLVFLSCSKEDFNNSNPYLPNYGFSTTINMTLPQYDNLRYPANGVYLFTGVEGVRGIFVFNTGSGYVAFDAACPNQALSSCSTMELDGTTAICPCDDAVYSLFTGQSVNEGKEYPMKRYRVELLDDYTIRVYN